MKIIILGCNQVGSTLAETLVNEDHDVTVVDDNRQHLNYLQSHIDIRTVNGRPSHPDVLSMADAGDSDMLIAVTNNDEINMIACQVAHSLFSVPSKIARIHNHQYLAHQELFGNNNLPIDVYINPEQLVTNQIKQLIEYPGALQIINFNHGKIILAVVRATKAAKLTGTTLKELLNLLPEFELRIVAIYRGHNPVPLDGETRIENGDEVFFICAPQYIQDTLSAFGCNDKPVHKVIIGGYSHVGLELARALENDYEVKIIDKALEHIDSIVTDLNSTIILQGDISDKKLLLAEDIEKTDIFCAITNDDELNIMSCIQAKRLGVSRVMAVVSRSTYVDLLEGDDIDIAISPQQATIGQILAEIRKGDIASVHALRRGAAEAIEVMVPASPAGSKLIGKRITDVKLPPNTNIGGLIRDDMVVIKNRDTIIAAGDHLLLFVLDKKHIKDIEHLLQS